MTSSASLIERLQGIVTFKAPVYREVAHDANALQPAAIIVIVVTLLVGVISGLLGSPLGFIGAILLSIFGALIGWLLGSWLTAFVASRFFQGQTNTTEMLRILGHTYIFQIPVIIPLVGSIIALVLGIVATVLAIREAAGLDTQKAILTAIIVNVIIFVLSLILGGVIAGLTVAGTFVGG
ncbi:MAG: hypothetical protein KatS3mg053_3273 [Candidatus Roseilinea sp.]|nr:MAG: hypothetical protein KatS3mg053_3273 [Candidatus Roseilinea sp.]